MLNVKDATHISVVIKGSKVEALREGHTHGIPLRFVRSTSHGEVVCIADMEYRRAIAKWFNISGAGEMPVGTPLFFSETYVAPSSNKMHD